MSLFTGSTADYLVDRRRLRRRLLFWRIAAFAVAGLATLAWGLQASGRQGAGTLLPHVARVRIHGLITGDDATIKLLSDLEKSSASAVILAVDSPGGTTAGSERLFDALRKLAAKKPVVATVGNLAASGAYIAALGADHIVARGNALVGSIGVLFEYPNLSGLLDKVGVQVETVKSAPLKASPNGFEPTSPEARAALASLVDDSFAWFKGLVRDRRGLTDAELAAVDDGRVFTGRQGLPLKLVDEIGGEDEAVRWLETAKGVAKDLPVRDWKPQSGLPRFRLFSAAASLAAHAGWPALATALAAGEDLAGRPPVGLNAVWVAGSP